MTLVDTNVLLDVLTGDPNWLKWSAETLHARRVAGPLLIDAIVYAELSLKSVGEDELDDALKTLGVEMAAIPKSALFLAGQAFARYRKLGGSRTGVLPDFFIGAHACVAGIPLLTRDVRRYRTYFSDVELIAPV